MIVLVNGVNRNGESVITTAFDADRFKLFAENIVGVPDVPTDILLAVISPDADISLLTIKPIFGSTDAVTEPVAIDVPPPTPPMIAEPGMSNKPAPLPLNTLPDAKIKFPAVTLTLPVSALIVIPVTELAVI